MRTREITDAFGKRKVVSDAEIWVDHDTGLINIPGRGQQELQGNTSGHAYREVQHRDQEFSNTKRQIQRMKLSDWQCTRCHQVMSGEKIQLTVVNGEFRLDAPLCPRCGSAVVKSRDALDLTKPPAGSI